MTDLQKLFSARREAPHQPVSPETRPEESEKRTQSGAWHDDDEQVAPSSRPHPNRRPHPAADARGQLRRLVLLAWSVHDRDHVFATCTFNVVTIMVMTRRVQYWWWSSSVILLSIAMTRRIVEFLPWRRQFNIYTRIPVLIYKKKGPERFRRIQFAFQKWTYHRQLTGTRMHPLAMM